MSGPAARAVRLLPALVERVGTYPDFPRRANDGRASESWGLTLETEIGEIEGDDPIPERYNTSPWVTA